MAHAMTVDEEKPAVVAQAIVSEALLTKFEDAKWALDEIADMMDCAGLDLSDINEARSSLYEAETHLRKAGL